MAVIFHLIPTLAGGGAERQLALLAIEQARCGHSVHVGMRRGGVHEVALRQHGVELHALGNHRGLNPLLCFKIWRLLRTLRPNVVQTWLMQMDLVGGFAACAANTPWVATERSSAMAYASSGMAGRERLRQGLCRRACAVVANSFEGADYWRAALPHQCIPKIHKIGNAIDLGGIQTQVGIGATARRADAEGVKHVLVVGRLIESKALDVVIKAMHRLPASLNLKLRIVGDGPMRPLLASWIREGAARDRISIHDYCDTWWQELAQASVLVSMSRYEGQPNVVLEAMAGGCPLIVSDIPAHREILSSDAAKFVPVDHEDALVSALSEVLADPEAARVRAKAAFDVVSSMTVASAAKAYDDVYRNSIKGWS